MTDVDRFTAAPWLKIAGALLPAMLCSLPNPAGAQAIDTNRPGFSYSPGVVLPGQWQLETGVAYDRPGGGAKSLSLPLAELRVGVAEDIELFVSSVSWSDVQAGGDGASGLGDIVIGTKIALGNTTSRTSMAVLFQVSAPTGDSEFSSDDWDPAAAFIWLHDGRVTLAGTARVTRSGNRHQLDNSLKLPFALSDTRSAFVEWEANLPEGRDDAHWLNGGFQWLLRATLQFDLNAGIGLNDTAGDYRLGAGLSMRF